MMQAAAIGDLTEKEIIRKELSVAVCIVGMAYGTALGELENYGSLDLFCKMFEDITNKQDDELIAYASQLKNRIDVNRTDLFSTYIPEEKFIRFTVLLERMKATGLH